MGPSIAIDILRAVFSGVILTILFGALAMWVRVVPRLFRGQPVLPGTPIVERRETPWGLGTILLILAVYVLGSREAFAFFGLEAREAPAGAAAPARGDNAPPAPAPDAPAKPPAPPRDADDALPLGLSALQVMSIQGAINGVFLLLLPGIARLTAGARLRDYGLSPRDWRRQVAIGLGAVLFLMPMIYAIQAACIYSLGLTAHEIEENKHPLEKMLRESFSPGIASVAFVTAVILAPAFEEWLFRGFIQPWLIKLFDRLAAPTPPIRSEEDPNITSSAESPQGPPLPEAPLADAATVSLPVGPPAEIEFWEPADQPPDAAADAADPSPTPPLFYRPRSPVLTGAAIVLTSMIFAGLHAPQWPAPIPLFILALGLGLVAQRTGSLLAPICMHAVFNGFSTLMLFYVALEPPDKNRPPARPVLERVAPADRAGQAAPHVDPGPHPRAG